MKSNAREFVCCRHFWISSGLFGEKCVCKCSDDDCSFLLMIQNIINSIPLFEILIILSVYCRLVREERWIVMRPVHTQTPCELKMMFFVIVVVWCCYGCSLRHTHYLYFRKEKRICTCNHIQVQGRGCSLCGKYICSYEMHVYVNIYKCSIHWGTQTRNDITRVCATITSIKLETVEVFHNFQLKLTHERVFCTFSYKI